MDTKYYDQVIQAVKKQIDHNSYLEVKYFDSTINSEKGFWGQVPVMNCPPDFRYFLEHLGLYSVAWDSCCVIQLDNNEWLFDLSEQMNYCHNEWFADNQKLMIGYDVDSRFFAYDLSSKSNVIISSWGDKFSNIFELIVDVWWPTDSGMLEL